MSGKQDEESGNSSGGVGLQENLLATSFAYMGGVIRVEDMLKFKKLIIRSTRAQTLIQDFDFVLSQHEKIKGDNYDMSKRIIILAYQDGGVIREKLNRIIGSFDGEFINIQPETLMDEKNTVNLKKEETKAIIVQSKSMFRDYLIACDKNGDANVSVFKMYKLFIQREKSIYMTLNQFKHAPDS